MSKWLRISYFALGWTAQQLFVFQFLPLCLATQRHLSAFFAFHFVFQLCHLFLILYASVCLLQMCLCVIISKERKIKAKLTQNHPHQCEKCDSKQHGQISECVLEVYQQISPPFGVAVIEEGERQAIEVAEAVLVRMVAVVPSVFTVHTQVPLTCRDTERGKPSQEAFRNEDQRINNHVTLHYLTH